MLYDVELTYTVENKAMVNTRLRMRKSVRAALVDLGGTESHDQQVADIPPSCGDRALEIVLEAYPKWSHTTYDHRPVKDYPEDRIGWGRALSGHGYSYSVGVVGNMPVFRLENARTTDYPTGVELITDLPGIGRARARSGRSLGVHASYVEAHAAAERALNRFLEKLGATWID
jgi:hypothetical protein